LAATKIFPIKSTEVKALAYIANPKKTDNGRLICTFGCNRNPAQASRDFEAIRAYGTGLNTVLSQHFIQSFSPGEITPERALEIGKELCKKFLHDEYQYYLAVHTDKNHIHLHCIFNNVNLNDGRTFETHENQGKVAERAWKKLFDLSDEVCRRHYLSVIENPEIGSGKSYFEWDMNRQGFSWKSKLKFAIDNVVKESENFEDFLEKCRANGIEVDYNPSHKIDLKFRLKGQQKWSRARTLGWYYQSEIIRRRIDMYKGEISFIPKTKIRKTTADFVQENRFVENAIDRKNMKVASLAANVATKYGLELSEIGDAAVAAFMKKSALSDELNVIQTKIEDVTVIEKTVADYQKFRPYMAELKRLSGRQKTGYLSQHRDEINRYGECKDLLKKWFPDGNVPSLEYLKKQKNALIKERSEKHEKYTALKVKADELAKAKQTLDDYLKNERNVQEQKRKRKNGDLE
jgi:hypothetical protein